MLPPPSGQAAVRAGRAFRDYVDRLRQEPEAAPAVDTPPPSPGSARRYDLALAKIGAPSAGEVAPPDLVLPVNEVAPADRVVPASEVAPTEPRDRPPPGAPTVRPPVHRPVIESLPQDVLEGAADSAMLSTDEAGGAAFEIVFNDELFADLACRISVSAGRVVATFRARDANLRRLIEAEAGRLRARLEERGLKVEEVRVELAG